MRHHESVTKIMSSAPFTAHHGQPLSELRTAMTERGFHHIPVVSGKRLIGMISASDMLRLSFGDPSAQDPRAVNAALDHAYKLEEVMVKAPITLQAKDTVKHAAELLSEGKFHALPVVDGEDLVGIVTSTDLIRYLLAQY